MRGIIRELKATGTIVPQINIDVELTNDRDELVQILGYSMELSICNVPIGDISRFVTIQPSIPISYPIRWIK